MSVRDLIRALPRWLADWLRPGDHRSDTEELQGRVKRATAVLEMMRTPGWQAYFEAADKADRAELEKLLLVGTWEQYLEQRGAIRGGRDRLDLVRQITDDGAKAEAELERHRVGRD